LKILAFIRFVCIHQYSNLVLFHTEQFRDKKKIVIFENIRHITFYVLLDAPAPPTDLTVQECGSRRVSIIWVPPVLDGNSPIVRYLVRYSPTQGICLLIKVASLM
jgi:hypothetical protein